MPVFGCSSRPVRLRPPSMKYSIEWPRAMMAARYFDEHHGVERVAAEAAADEECAALAQEPPDDRQVQVDAGGDVRDRKAVLVDRVRQQQVVHVAAVAGHVDDFVALGHLAERVDVRELDAVVEAVPQARQELQRDGTKRCE